MSFQHNQMNQKRGLCKPDDQACYVFIRFNKSCFQRCVNSLVKQMSVSANYLGEVIGVTEEIHILEGDSWPADKGMAVLRVECVCEAERLFQNTPEIKQQDWLGGDIDIVAVPVRDVPVKTKLWMEVIDMTHIDDYNSFCHNYVEKVNPYLAKLDGAHVSTGVVAASSQYGGNGPKTIRGRWNPSTLIVNQFDTKEAFDNAYCSEEYQPLKQMRQEVSRANVLLFGMTPLIHKHPKKCGSSK